MNLKNPKKKKDLWIDLCSCHGSMTYTRVNGLSQQLQFHLFDLFNLSVHCRKVRKGQSVSNDVLLFNYKRSECSKQMFFSYEQNIFIPFYITHGCRRKCFLCCVVLCVVKFSARLPTHTHTSQKVVLTLCKL